MLTRIILAVVVAVAVGIILVGLVGPIIASLGVPVAHAVGRFFIDWGYVIGALAGLWYFFAGGSFNFPTFRKPQ